MSPRSKEEYTEAIFKRYKKASKAIKSKILDEFCATTGYHRKSAIKRLRSYTCFVKPQPKKRGPKPLYPPEIILKPLKRIWLAANLPGSKRLKVIIPLWLPGYIQDDGPVSPEI